MGKEEWGAEAGKKYFVLTFSGETDEDELVSAFGTAEVDSTLLHNDQYLYHNITRGNIYPMEDVAISKNGSRLIQIRDNKGIARWVAQVYFKVELSN